MLHLLGVICLIMISGRKIDALTDSCETEYSCSNCTTVKLCVLNSNQTLQVKKEFQCNASAPFCEPNSGTCTTNSLIPTCGIKDPKFICSHDGYLPHPTDCYKYYACLGGKAYLHSCGDNIYNSVSEACDGDRCSSLDCGGKTGIKIAFDENTAIFGYCYNGTVYRVDKCPGKFQLNEDLQICVPVCNKRGLQADPFDCTSYYSCTYTSYNHVLIHKKCPENETFDAVNYHCTSDKSGNLCEHYNMYNVYDQFIQKN